MPVKISESQERLIDFLREKSVGVLSTADLSANPHGAAIYFIVERNLEIYFVTKDKTKKHENLKSNPRASLVVFDPKSQSTAQICGSVSEVQSVALANDVFAKIMKVSVESNEDLDLPLSKLQAGGYVVHKLDPDSARLAVFVRPSRDSEDIFETVR